MGNKHTKMATDYSNTSFLEFVGKGEQDLAEKMLKNIPELLTFSGTFTDYSGRTFTCTAYEYAWWAKDSHMRRMLETYMDNDTKTHLLACIDELETNGLTYTHNGEKITGSKQFDLQPNEQPLCFISKF